MANQIQEAFDSIKADSGLKESTRRFLSRKRARERRRHLLRWVTAVLCVLLLISAGAEGYSWMQAPVSFISIDVNPSIELALNRFERVVEVSAFNAQGAEVIGGLDLKGRKYTDAVNRIVESPAMLRYLSDDEAELVFTVAASGRESDTIQTGIEHCHSHSGHSCYSVSADIGLVTAAHENGLSLGKYSAYLELAGYDDSVTVDDCRDMSVSEIHRCIRNHKGSGAEHGAEEYEEADTGEPEDENPGYGDAENESAGDLEPEYGEDESGWDEDSGNPGSQAEDDESGGYGEMPHHGGNGHHRWGHE